MFGTLGRDGSSNSLDYIALTTTVPRARLAGSQHL
jgi:hypothetical protein